MGTDREPRWIGPGDDDVPDGEWSEAWEGFDEYGPRMASDDIWFLDRVISKGYPALRRGERQFDGQTSIYDFI